MKKTIRILAALLAGVLLTGCASADSQKKTGENMQVYTLSNPNADETTVKVYEYISTLGQTGTLSAQQESTWMGSVDYEMDYIEKTTGRLPAMRGLDYMHDDFAGVNSRAVKWWREGGLVTICWHTGSDFCGEWKDCMETAIEDWDAALTEGTPEYEKLIAGMDKGAKALLELQEQGVPVLWRPFHEFDGGWFWWGKGGAENFVKLWRLMYTRYTDYWKLNNLIWVLGYSHIAVNCRSWYPGDEYVDIIGADSYRGGVEKPLYQMLIRITTAKPYAFHECGTNPTAAQLQQVPWAWFMTWHTSYITDENKPAALKELYNSDYVITRDELPQFITGPE